ncbi:MAG: AsmA family protein, partial [bacterium]
VIAVLVIVMIIGVKLYFNDAKIKEIIISSAHDELGREVTLDKASVSFWGGLGVKLENVAVNNPKAMSDNEQLLQARKIELKLSLIPLLFSEYRIDRLVVESPVINLIKNNDGSSNYAFTLADTLSKKASDETKAAAALVTFNMLEITEGKLKYIDDSTNSNLLFNNFSLTTSLSNPYNNHYRSEGNLDIDDGSFGFGISVKSVKMNLFWAADYDPDKKYLTLKNSGFRVGDLEFNLSGEFTHRNEKSGRFVIQSDKVEARKLFSLVTDDENNMLEGFDIDGNFSLNAELIYDNSREPSFVYTGNAIISDMRMTYAEVDGELKFKSAMLDLKPDNLRFNIQDGSFNNKPLSGQFVVDNFEHPYLNGDLKGEIDLVFLKPFLPTENDHNLSGQTRFDLNVAGLIDSIENLNVTGNMKINNGSYSSLLIPEPIDTFTLDAYFDNRLLKVNNFSSKSKRSNVSFNGRLTNVIPFLFADSDDVESMEAVLDGKLKAASKLILFQQYLSQKGNPVLKGDLEMDLAVRGDIIHPTTINASGLVLINNGYYNDSLLPEPVKNFNARFKVFPDSVRVEEFKALFTSSDMSLSGTLIKPIPYLLPIENLNRENLTKPIFNFSLKSNTLNIDKLFPEIVPGSQISSDSIQTQVVVDSVSPVILPDIIARGDFKVDKLIYDKIDFTNVKGNISYEDRVIYCTDITGKVYTGDISGDARVDLTDFENPVYTGKYTATQIEADDFMSRFTKFSGFIFGKFNFSGTYKAQGWEPEEFLNSLEMDSDADMQEGKVVTSGAIFNTMKSFSETIGSGFEKEQYLKNARSKITVSNGKVMLDTMTTKLGSLGDLLLDGNYSFKNEVAYSGVLILSKDASAKLRSNKGFMGAISGILTDQTSERINLPLMVTGTIDNPDLKIDYSSLTKEAKKELLDGVGDKFKDLFKK